jgi:hypothetical protein
MSLASRLTKMEQHLSPEPIVHVFVFLGFGGEGIGPSASRTEAVGPQGERLIYLGFEPEPDTCPRPAAKRPAKRPAKAKTTPRTTPAPERW